MHWQFEPILIPLLAAAAICGSLVVFAWRRRSGRGALPFILLMAALTQWTLSYILELSSVDLPIKLLGLKLSFIGVVIGPSALFLFALLYTNRGDWIRWPRWLVFVIVPLFTLILVWTWDKHYLFWREVSLQNGQAYSVLHTVKGPAFVVHAVYSYILLFLGTAIVLQSNLGLPRPFRGQKATLILSILIPWLANLLFVFELGPFSGLDLTPFAFAISGLGVTWSLFGFRLFDLIPVGRESIFQNLGDGVILVDRLLRIQDFNPAADAILPTALAQAIGKPAPQVLKELSGNTELTFARNESRVEVILEREDQSKNFELVTSPLSSRAGDITGWLIVLRDVTLQKLTETYLHRRTAFLEVFNEITSTAVVAGDLQLMMRTALQKALDILELDSGVVWVNDDILGEGLSSQIEGELSALCAPLLAGPDRELCFEDLAQLESLDLETEPEKNRFFLEMKHLGFQALISAPVASAENCYGCMLLFSKFPKRWQLEDKAFLEAVANQIGVVAERIMQVHEIQERNDLMQRLIEQSAKLTRHFSVTEVLPAISLAVTELLHPKRVNVILGDAIGSPVHPIQEDLGEIDKSAGTGLGPCPVLIQDVAQVFGNREGDQLVELDYRALGSWPLVYEQRTLAVVSLYYDEPHVWTKSELEVMQAFTRQAAIALESARMYDVEREQFILTDALRELATVVNSTLNYNEVLDQVLLNLKWVLPHDRADIMLVEDGIARVVHSRGYEAIELEDWIKSMQMPVDQVPVLNEIVNTGQVLSLPDTMASPLWADFQPGSLCRAYLGAPIISKGNLVGVINVYSEKTGVYLPHHAATLRSFSDQAAIALENASLYASLQEQAEETSALYRAITRLFTPGADLKTLAEEIVQAVTSEFQSDHCSLLLYDEQSAELEIIAQSGYLQVNPKRLQVDGPGLTTAAFRSGEVVYAPDVNQDSRYVSGTPKTHSEIVFPLHFHGSVFGVLNLESQKFNAFTEKDRRILLAFADRVAMAIENVRLFDLTDTQLRQINLLNSITRVSLEAFDFHIMLAVMADRLRDLFYANGCYIALWDEEQQMILPGTGSHVDEELNLHLSLNGNEPSLVELVLNANAPLAIGNLHSSALISPRQVKLVSSKAMLGLPLAASQQKLGAVLLFYDRARQFSTAELRLAEQATGQVALAIGRARSLEDSQRRAEEAENLRQATASLAAALDLHQVLDTILDHLEKVIPYDRASVYLLEEETLHTVAASGFAIEQQVLGHNFPSSNALAQQIKILGHPLILEDAAFEPRFSGWIETGFVHGWMGVPLIIHGSLIGFLTLGSQLPGAFGREQAHLAQAFANQAAAAIANARLFSEVQRLAITDPLTGLYNRRGFSEIGHREMERARRYKRPLSVIMLDIDHFKRVNDTYKHAVGDQVLRTLAERCRQRTREVDILGRYGGEEIVILLPETDRAGALRAADHLRRDVAEKPFNTEVGPLDITISLGVADSMDGELDLDILIDRADAAMYAAKQSGRNRVMSY
jgi:diguanylate cyclase (GGDEF)-like protein/PAS domain S-box-containing protein